ncbi:MAG: SIMPL domain-containing protein [Solirubrobacterales bacterium]
MTSRSRTPILTALLALALLVPASAEAAVERTVSVTADATLKVPNDSASLGFSVSRERRTRGAALQAISGGLRRVITAVQGIPGVGDITTGRISVRKSFRGKRVVYRAVEGIGVTLHQPDKAGELVTAAIGAGATGVRGPNFFVGDTEAAFANALAAAFDKAKLRATALATRAGGTLGPALTIDEGEGPELIPQLKEASGSPAADCVTSSPASPGPSPVAVKRIGRRCAAAPPPVKPGTSTVTATVHVVFALQ